MAALTTFTGGFLDAFTYVGHGGVFANSMTGNVVLMGVLSAEGKWQEVVDHIPPLLAFLAGIYLVHKKQLSNRKSFFKRLASLSLLLEIIFLLIISFLPASFPDNILVPMIALVASIQYESFSKIENYSYSSVTTTVNLRGFAEAAYDYRAGRSVESRQRIKMFGLISLCFLLGALAGGISTAVFFNTALWIPVTLLSMALVLVSDNSTQSIATFK